MTRLDEDARDAPATAPAPGPASRGTPPKPPTSGRFTPQARPPVRGTVISVPDEATTRLPLLPILGMALALAAVGVTWWVLGSRSEVSSAAGGTTTSRTTPTPATTPTGPPEPPSALEATATDVVSKPAEAIETPPPAAAPTPVPDGVLDATVPSGAELRIDGQRVPPGPRRVSPGRHTIEVVRPDVRGIQRETVEVGAGQTLRRTFTADQYGWLQVVVIPWAEVFVDGESVGQTPMPRIKAAVGEHTVVLRHPEVEERRQTVVVRAGETTLVRVTLQGVSG